MRVVNFHCCRDLVPDSVGSSPICSESLLHRAHYVTRGTTSRMNSGCGNLFVVPTGGSLGFGRG